MKHYIVTVRMLKRNPDHDPRNKKSGPCPVSQEHCTDVTGEHHSFLAESYSEDEVREFVREYGKIHGYRLTRLEEVRL